MEKYFTYSYIAWFCMVIAFSIITEKEGAGVILALTIMTYILLNLAIYIKCKPSINKK